MPVRPGFLMTMLLITCLHASAQSGSSDGKLKLASTGTGFAINSDGYLVTNNHVVSECVFVYAIANDGSRYDTTIVAKDTRNDLALLKGRFASKAFASFRRSSVRSGDDIIALGFPYSGLLATDVNVSAGIVSAMAGLRNDTSKIQISAPVQPGNSGGPLLDSTGLVAGVVVEKLNALAVARATGDLPQNVNFAIKGEVVQSFLRSHGVEPSLASASRQRTPLADIVQQARPYMYLLECIGRDTQAALPEATRPPNPAPVAAADSDLGPIEAMGNLRQIGDAPICLLKVEAYCIYNSLASCRLNAGASTGQARCARRY